MNTVLKSTFLWVLYLDSNDLVDLAMLLAIVRVYLP